MKNKNISDLIASSMNTVLNSSEHKSLFNSHLKFAKLKDLRSAGVLLKELQERYPRQDTTTAWHPENENSETQVDPDIEEGERLIKERGPQLIAEYNKQQGNQTVYRILPKHQHCLSVYSKYKYGKELPITGIMDYKTRELGNEVAKLLNFTVEDMGNLNSESAFFNALCSYAKKLPGYYPYKGSGEKGSGEKYIPPYNFEILEKYNQSKDRGPLPWKNNQDHVEYYDPENLTTDGISIALDKARNDFGGEALTMSDEQFFDFLEKNQSESVKTATFKSNKAFDVAIKNLLKASAALDFVGMSNGSTLSLKLASLVADTKQSLNKFAQKPKIVGVLSSVEGQAPAVQVRYPDGTLGVIYPESLEGLEIDPSAMADIIRKNPFDLDEFKDDETYQPSMTSETTPASSRVPVTEEERQLLNNFRLSQNRLYLSAAELNSPMGDMALQEVIDTLNTFIFRKEEVTRSNLFQKLKETESVWSKGVISKVSKLNQNRYLRK